MNRREDEIELEGETKSERGIDVGKVFVSQSGSPDRFPSIHNALTAKNASCDYFFSSSLFVCRCNEV